VDEAGGFIYGTFDVVSKNVTMASDDSRFIRKIKGAMFDEPLRFG
jgi:hypothetical protein